MSEPVPASPPTEEDLSDRRLGDFHLLRRLGRGAMAEVYLAEQGSLRRQVAVKVLKRHLAADQTYVRRFHHEAQAVAALVHANIVQVYEVGCADGLHYLAQEYVQGQNLRDFLARHGPLDARLALAVLRQVAAALIKAADAGIVHRDIKPENIMLARSGEVKVADFGLARVAGDGGGLGLTQVGVTMGTPLYMSPEQVEGRSLDPRSDLYSLGVTSFHMLTGRPPFTGETALAVAVQHLKSAPPSLAALRPDLPPALVRIVHKLLEKNPADRYANPRELLRDLRGAAAEAGLGADDADAAATLLDLPELAGSIAATQRLGEAMKTAALVAVRRRRRVGWLVAAVVLAAALGAAAAAVKRTWFDRSLLASDAQAGIPRQTSAREQFFAAQVQLADREAWLQSVIEYFPADEYYAPRAQQELVRLYFQENRFDEAAPLCAALAERKAPGDEAFRAFGLAGECVVLTSEDRLAEAARRLAELLPIREHLDPRMGRLMSYVLSANRKALDDQAAGAWDEWLKSLPAG